MSLNVVYVISALSPVSLLVDTKEQGRLIPQNEQKDEKR